MLLTDSILLKISKSNWLYGKEPYNNFPMRPS